MTLALFAVLALEAAVFAVSTIPGVRSEPGFVPWLDGWVQGAAYVTTALVCLARVGSDRRDRRAWSWIAAALSARALAFVVYLGYVRTLDPLPYPSVADAGWLAMPLLLLVGIVLLARPAVAGVTAVIVLDALVVAAGCAALSISLMGETVNDLATADLSAAGVITNLAYPITDLMLLVAIAGAMTLFDRPTLVGWSLAFGVAGFAAVDGVFLYQSSAGTFRPGTWVSALSLVATATIALAAWMPDGRERSLRLTGIPRMLVPGAFAMLALAVLIYATQEPVALGGVCVAATGVVLAIGRGLLSYRETQRLSEALRSETERMRATFRAADSIGIVAGTREGITFFSPGAEKIFGYRAEEVEGRLSVEALGIEPALDGVASESAVTGRSTGVRKDGSHVPLEVTTTPLHADRGRPFEFIAVARDVSHEFEIERYRATRDALEELLARGLPLADTLRQATRTVAEGSGWKIAHLWLAQGEALQCASYWHDASMTAPEIDAFLRSARIAPGEGMAGRVWVEGASLWVEDNAAEMAGVVARSVLSVPLSIAGETIGVLQLADSRARASNREALILMEATAAKLARHLEREKVERELRLAREDALQASMAKSDFVSHMSHELRTPLNAVMGFGQLIEMDASDPEQREHAQQILTAGSHLLTLIDELLDVARIERGEVQVVLESVSVADALRVALDLAGPLVDARGLFLDVEDAGDHHVRADFKRLTQVLINLLSNAVKYNRPEGRIIVGITTPRPGCVRVSVADTGVGIADEDLALLFQPFERLGAGATGEPGTGLGLAISKGLMTAMGGTIRAESEPGVGSTFHLELPVADVREEDVAPHASDPEGAAVGPELAATVLCVEDNTANVRLLEDLFAGRPGIDLLIAADGTTGLELARRSAPDVILLDMHLPDFPGETVIARLRAHPETGGIPVVVVSADATEGSRARAVQAGAEAYVTKPIDVATLLSVIGSVLGLSPAPVRDA